ncbi:hypothetical protein MS2017_0366 [Bathymodiolus thermophilus thioautotrophic gill symbiont]|uniref:Uncharacterized protein n=1 Tax=Bathymodiolus thermophilus thioautotrophic gill symbiont TaxID=2360 RepID=A0A3G3IKV0_9GAMM|nr:hypothetical protein [Bathymodiolus thermophilus thioautotrophic gill symbiont]AYQ56112.1 hypothetical protein MS2017_0366 [Bathymodiolus thermophilus thioautotrophic gill symbiont]
MNTKVNEIINIAIGTLSVLVQRIQNRMIKVGKNMAAYKWQQHRKTNGGSLCVLETKVIKRDLCINMNNHQESSSHPLGNFLNPALVLLRQGLRKSPSGQKLNFANHPYLCKGL